MYIGLDENLRILTLQYNSTKLLPKFNCFN